MESLKDFTFKIRSTPCFMKNALNRSVRKNKASYSFFLVLKTVIIGGDTYMKCR